MKRSKQLRFDQHHVLLINMSRTYRGFAYDSDVAAEAVRVYAEQLAANLALAGKDKPLAALVPLLCEAARAAYPDLTTHDPYRYDHDSRQVLRWETGRYVPIPVACRLFE